MWTALLIISAAMGIVSVGVRGYIAVIAKKADGKEDAADYGWALLAGVGLAVLAGAVTGAALPVEGVNGWLGMVAGLVGACAPWTDALVRSLLSRWAGEVAVPGGDEGAE